MPQVRTDTLVRPAAVSDLPAVRTLYARAFGDDPMMRWLFPDAGTRPEALAAWLGTYLERYLLAPGAAPTRHRGAERDGVVVGAAFWRWPDDDVAAPGVLPTATGLLTALVGDDHAALVAAGLAQERAVRPTAPHAYLHYLAVDAAHRGTGVARALVEEGVARAESDGLPVLVETTNPANVAVYEAFGFGVVARVRLGTGPDVTILTR